MRTSPLTFTALTLAALPLLPPPAMAQTDPIGAATAIYTQVTGDNAADAPRTLVMGDVLYRDERISTDGAGQLHILFQDGSNLFVGPNSDLRLDRFVYDPVTSSGEFALSISRGVLRFIGGKITKGEDLNATVETPLGVIGIRGGMANIFVEGGSGETRVVNLFGETQVFPSGATRPQILSRSSAFANLGSNGDVETGIADAGQISADREAFEPSAEQVATSSPQPVPRTAEDQQAGNLSPPAAVVSGEIPPVIATSAQPRAAEVDSSVVDGDGRTAFEDGRTQSPTSPTESTLTSVVAASAQVSTEQEIATSVASQQLTSEQYQFLISSSNRGGWFATTRNSALVSVTAGTTNDSVWDGTNLTEYGQVTSDATFVDGQYTITLNDGRQLVFDEDFSTAVTTPFGSNLSTTAILDESAQYGLIEISEGTQAQILFGGTPFDIQAIDDVAEPILAFDLRSDPQRRNNGGQTFAFYNDNNLPASLKNPQTIVDTAYIQTNTLSGEEEGYFATVAFGNTSTVTTGVNASDMFMQAGSLEVNSTFFDVDAFSVSSGTATFPTFSSSATEARRGNSTDGFFDAVFGDDRPSLIVTSSFNPTVNDATNDPTSATPLSNATRFSSLHAFTETTNSLSLDTGSVQTLNGFSSALLHSRPSTAPGHSTYQALGNTGATASNASFSTNGNFDFQFNDSDAAVSTGAFADSGELTSNLSLRLGATGGSTGSGDGIFINNERFAVLGGVFTVSSTGLNTVDSLRYALVSSGEATVPSSATLCTSCDFATWGWWSSSLASDVTLTNTGTQTRSDAILGSTFVVGDLAVNGELPLTGSASYSGQAIGNIYNGTDEYTSFGSFSSTYNFATNAGSFTLNMDGTTYNPAITGANALFSGSDTVGARTAEIEGGFLGNGSNAAAGMGGRFTVEDGANYVGTGTFLGSQ